MCAASQCKREAVNAACNATAMEHWQIKLASNRGRQPARDNSSASSGKCTEWGGEVWACEMCDISYLVAAWRVEGGCIGVAIDPKVDALMLSCFDFPARGGYVWRRRDLQATLPISVLTVVQLFQPKGSRTAPSRARRVSGAACR